MSNRRIRPLSILLGGVFGAAFLGLLLVGALWVLHKYPSYGAYASDSLRKVLGDQPVAALEAALFQAQDAANQAEYRLGLLKPASPFGTAAQPAGSGGAPVGARVNRANGPIPVTGISQAAPAFAQPVDPLAQSAALNGVTSSTSEIIQPGSHASPQSADPQAWPAQVAPGAGGAGAWQPYLTNASGQVVAYRTFLQPDPQRPYALVGVVAFDLHAARLHYVIGFNEPYASKNLPKQPGAIPAADLQPNVLIAAFNGGFKFQHGNFGSLANGFTSAPLLNGLSAVAIYKDGTVKMGEWGKDIQSTPDLVAVRQNGPLMIQDGQVSALVDNQKDWGETVGGAVYTWRSGMAISADGRTLYYFAGPSLSASTLAGAMMMVHPQNAMQLDINSYWVHFAAIQSASAAQPANQKLTSIPLFPKEMADGKDRYQYPYSRDFFYVTVTQ